jgi:hypothetical protein
LRKEGRKRFFFEKRSKKLLLWAAGHCYPRRPIAKVSCRTFFQKSAYSLPHRLRRSDTKRF